MQGVVDAGQVAHAYTVPLDGVTSGLQYYDQLAARKQREALALKDKKDADALSKQQILSKAFNDLDIGTGTPWDEVGHAHVNEAYNKVMEFQRANPNASPTDLWGAAYDATRGLASGIDNAKKASAYVDDLTKRANAEYPHLDQTALKAYFQHKVFRDDKGNILTAPNTSYTPSELQSSEYRSQLMNDEAARGALHKEMADGFKPEPYAFNDPADPAVVVRGKTRAYLDQNGQPLAAPVAWTPPVDPANPNAPANPTTAYGVPAGLLGRLKSAPVFGDMLAAEKRKMKTTYGDQLKGASDDQIEQLAAAQLVRDYGSRDGIELPTRDTKYANFLEQKKQREITQAAEAHRLHNSDVQLGINMGRYSHMLTKDDEKKQAADKQYVPTILAAAAKGDPEAQQIVQSNTKVIKVMGQSMPAVHISGMHGKPLKDPENGRDVNVYQAQDPVYGPVLVYKYLDKNPTTKQWEESEKDIKVVGEKEGTLTGGLSNGYVPNVVKIHKGNLVKEMQRFDSQFKERKNNFLKYWQAYDESLPDAGESVPPPPPAQEED